MARIGVGWLDCLGVARSDDSVYLVADPALAAAFRRHHTAELPVETNGRRDLCWLGTLLRMAAGRVRLGT